jgi:hypothetical protein
VQLLDEGTVNAVPFLISHQTANRVQVQRLLQRQKLNSLQNWYERQVVIFHESCSSTAEDDPCHKRRPSGDPKLEDKDALSNLIIDLLEEDKTSGSPREIGYLVFQIDRTMQDRDG